MFETLLAVAGEAVNLSDFGSYGKISAAAAAFGVPIGIGLIGFKACESVGRNPEASTKILVQSILCMALVEAVLFIAIFLDKLPV